MTHLADHDVRISADERGLRRFGYADREAAFLKRAGLSGGYFIRRQAARFLGCKDGGAVTQLVQKALDLEHARCSTGFKGVHLYHLASRPFYAALGDPNNRNRRRHELTQIKNRLMALDFALSHPNADILGTEHDRLALFAKLGVTFEQLPQRRFIGRVAGAGTTRYFVERHPILARKIGDQSSCELTFAFVDEGSITLSRFHRFLNEHAAIFAALTRFELVYVADSPRHFAAAAGLVAPFVDINGSGQLALPDGENGELLAYFQLRRRFEERQFNGFNREQLLQLRNGKDRFQEPAYEARYHLWRAGSDHELDRRITRQPVPERAVRRSFSTELLPHDYAVFEQILS